MRSAVRNLLGVVLAGNLGVAALAMPCAQAAGAREVRDPHYGEALFHFYQQDYFTALTRIMTAQHFARLPQQADDAELLRGGMLLSYGLHREAGSIFEALIEAGAPPPVRDRAWFFLAKIRYQRGYLGEAEDALARIGAPLPRELEDERNVLHAQVLARRERYAEAVAMLRRVSSRSDWGVYGRYNLGVALVRAGETVDGLALLDEIGRDRELRRRGEALAALRDKANVALGYVYLRNETPVWAKTFLDRVRLDGLMSSKALLGLGWAHSAHNEHERALVAWNELTRRSTTDTAVQEALLAVPYSLGKLGAFRQSLEQYERALAAYTDEIGRLDESIHAIQGGALVANILRENPGEESGWFWRVERVPDSPESRYLTELLAGHDFQEGLKNYRDLAFQIRHLEDWSRHIGVFRDALATRRQAYAQRLPRAIAGERARDIERVHAELQRVRDDLARIEREADAAALASEKERALLERLERVRRGAAQIADPAERARVQERYRLLNGLLAWDMTAPFPARLWEARKGVQESERLLQQMDQRRAALAQARADVPAGLDAFDARIDTLRGRITSLQAEMAQAAEAQEQHLVALAVEELTRRREQIGAYITQARFAVAQIYDQALRVEPAATEKSP